jgi:hypothetical protein
VPPEAFAGFPDVATGELSTEVALVTGGALGVPACWAIKRAQHYENQLGGSQM